MKPAPDDRSAAGRAGLNRLRIAAAINAQTKPPGSLGALEPLMAQIAATQGTLRPVLGQAHMLLFGADHGGGVSAYPRAVTAAMMANIASGGAAISVLCRAHGIALHVVDAGVDWDAPPAGVIARGVARGTRDMLAGPAMTAAQCRRAKQAGAALVAALPAADRVLGFGEMGIGNTTAAACITQAITGIDAVGRGTGVTGAALARKRRVVRAALALHSGADPLAAMGGFEIAMMTGAMQQAAREGRIIVVDGFVATAAWLAARPRARLLAHSVFAHVSAERAHRAVLRALGLRPLLDLEMRLGEGSGAALAIPLVLSAAALLREMASFDSAGIPDA